MLVLLFFASTSFFASHFSSLPIRANSVFANPAGLGISPCYEILVDYDQDAITTGIAVRYFSVAVRKADSLYFFEGGVGYKLPGAFSLGYAFRFGEVDEHRLGVIGLMTNEISIGYTTKIGDDWHMIGGLAIRPLMDYVIICGDIEYETVHKSTTYYAGVLLQPVVGLKAHFKTDDDFNWNAGIEFSLGKLVLGGLYSNPDKEISGAVLISSETYPTFLTREEEYPDFYE